MDNKIIELLLNQNVTHKKYGLGTIVDVQMIKDYKAIDYYIDVEFENKMIKFNTEAFNKYISLDEEITKQVLELLNKQNEEYKEYLRENKENLEKEKLFRNYSERYLAQGKSIAFKCAYCDGGATNNCLGFKGLCSEKRRAINCSGTVPAPFCPVSRCNGDNKITVGGDLEMVCYESRMLIDWKCYAGMDYETAIPRSISCARNNYVAFLVTKLPDFDEWVVFGAFLITKSFEGNEKYEGFVEGEREDCRVELSPEEAKKVLYWDFYKNKDGSRQWTGLFRYFDNNLTLKLLNHMLSVVNDSNKKAKITNIIREFSKVL